MDKIPLEQALIGKEFRRIKYGVSSWKDIISETEIHQKWDSELKLFIPHIFVKGKNTVCFYDLSEIGIIGNFVDKINNSIPLQIPH